MAVYVVDFTRKTFKKAEEISPFLRPITANAPAATLPQRAVRPAQSRVRLVVDEQRSN